MSEAAAEVLVRDFIFLQGKIQKRIGVALTAHGLGLSDYIVLDQLYNEPKKKLRRNELAERVGLTPSGITRLLNPLEKIGLVEKELNPRDARVSLVVLSSSGRRVYKEARHTFSHESHRLFDALTSSQLETFSEFTKLLTKN